MAPSPSKPLMLGNLPVLSGKDTPTRMALLLWGDSSVGKTTFAATAPGKKIWLNADPDGKNSIMHRDDVSFVDLDGLSIRELFNQFQNDNPFGLDTFLADHPEYETVCLDSATAISWRALQKVIETGVGSSRKANFTPTIEEPGISAYGGRNNVVLTCISGLLKVTAKHNRHCIITTHEDDPKVDPKTSEVLSYSMVLGGKLVNNFTWRLSEIWYMNVGADKKRRLAVWPNEKRKPMKSRIFRIGEQRQFILNYDAEKPDDAKGQMTIKSWYEQWLAGGSNKLTVPGGEKK